MLLLIKEYSGWKEKKCRSQMRDENLHLKHISNVPLVIGMGILHIAVLISHY